MIQDLFTKEIAHDKYLDPFNGFQERESTFEIRRDGITNVTARILPFRPRVFQRPDVNEYLAKSPQEKCPFCLPQRETLTPRFPQTIVDGGQFRRGEAVLFPNAFPHGRHNTVALFSARHYLGLEDLTPAVMRDGFGVCRDYFERMSDLSPDLQYASVNWNYMPPSGGGLLHPHLQTVMGERPTRFMQALCDSALRYERETGRRLWDDLLDDEKETGDRYIASTGSVEWLVSFAPRGMAGEIDFFLPGRASLFGMTEGDLDGLLSGLTRIFAYCNANNLISFNLALYGTLREDFRFPVQGRLVPRYPILPLGASDVNYFEKLHDEIICPVIPEQLCETLKPYFADAVAH